MTPNQESEQLIGDRNGDLSALQGRHWDAVIDTCGYVPGSVKRIMNALDSDRIATLHIRVERVGVCPTTRLQASDERAPISPQSPWSDLKKRKG